MKRICLQCGESVVFTWIIRNIYVCPKCGKQEYLRRDTKGRPPALDADRKAYARKRRAEGAPVRRIAKELSVSLPVVYRVFDEG
jgi:transposase-like protein